ncbi:tryptophan synthase subunit alpha [Streptomyces sp. PBH53]|uniref:tryptophan synthase subunit alpha n=1 Tax=Streptomyces sp. PBH53 TaxID=1577075 RepID=UPI0021C3D7A3|nr:tryptophan synthase subunit alpha [Streptomyces sp. PBH53]
MSTPLSWSAALLDDTLALKRQQDRCAVGLFLPVGYPSYSVSMDALHGIAPFADVLELGVPYSHPHDSPLIRQAAAQALSQGFRMQDLFEAVTELAVSTSAALLVKSYWAPIQQYGAEAFAEELAAAGGAGVLVPDLPAPAAAGWQKIARTAGLHRIPLVPARATAANLAAIGAASSGMVSVLAPGRTGVEDPLSPHLLDFVHRVRTVTGLPVGVCTGIRTPSQAAQVGTFADAVFVGTPLLRRMQAEARAPEAARAVARDFADAVRTRIRPA